jgi:hypothetical protein
LPQRGTLCREPASIGRTALPPCTRTEGAGQLNVPVIPCHTSQAKECLTVVLGESITDDPSEVGNPRWLPLQNAVSSALFGGQSFRPPRRRHNPSASVQFVRPARCPGPNVVSHGCRGMTGEVTLSKFGRNALGILSLLVGFATAPAGAQNLDAGKSPAQIFADTCSACHRRAQELKKPSASFLRSHYTTSQAEAASLAGYLAGIPGDPRGSQQRKQSGSATPTETRPARRQEQSKDQPKEQSREQPRSTQGPAESKGRRSRNVEEREKGAAPAAAAPVTTATPAPATAPAVQAPAAEPQPQTTTAPAPPARPPLEPLEE